MEYYALRNTVRVLRGAAVTLTKEQGDLLKKCAEAVAEYESEGRES
jgi:hypothetical protein